MWARHYLILCMLAALTACESNNARRTLIITGPVHVYRTSTPPAAYPGSDFIAVLGPKDTVQVLDVRAEDGYKAVKVRMSDGREGWVFSGEPIELRESP